MITPVKNQVLVEPFTTSEKTISGLFVPDSCRQQTSKCKVVAVGRGTKEAPMQYKEGDIVFRVKDWGVPIETEGKKYLLMEQSSILAKVKN